VARTSVVATVEKRLSLSALLIHTTRPHTGRTERTGARIITKRRVHKPDDGLPARFNIITILCGTNVATRDTSLTPFTRNIIIKFENIQKPPLKRMV